MSDRTIVSCAHDPCGCTFARENAVERGDALYCSPACAEGAGCDHADCNCARTGRTAGGERAGSPGNPAAPERPAPQVNPGHLADHNPAQGTPATRRNPEAGG